MSFIFRPNHATPGAPIGGKAGPLLVLRGRGLSIPEWFVVLPDACGPAAGASADGAVARELSAALAELCPAGELVAVRSSALDEDGLRHSFAGQLQSFLLVAPEDVAMKATAVVASAFSERVREYRERFGLGAPHPPAVLIQRMIHAEVSGVAFSADPLTGRRDVAVVTAVRGLGTALVNGEQDADTWRVDRSGAIVQRQPSGLQTTLDDGQVRAVAELARRVEQILGPPQDIEWAMAEGEFHLLQARPITALEAEAAHEPWGEKRKAESGKRKWALQGQFQGELNIWDNSNIVESYCGVTTPLTFSFARRAYEGVYRQFCQILAVPRAKIDAQAATFRQMLGLIRGRVYYNLLNWYRVLALLPGFTVNRRFMEQMMGVKEELPAEILSELSRASAGARLKDAFALGFSMVALAANHFALPRKIRRFRARLDDALTLADRPLSAMTAGDLVDYFRSLERKLLTRWDAPLLNDFFAMIFYGVLRRLVSRWVGDAAGTLQNDLLCGEGGMISAEPVTRIRALAALARRDARFITLLCDGSAPAVLAAMETVPGFAHGYREYLAKFGERCLEELKLESLTLHDDPMMLLRAIGRMARAPLPAQPAPGAGSRDQAEARIEQALARRPWRRWMFQWVLRQARRRVRERENLRFERTRVFGRVRRVFVELGRRWQAQGYLQEARDIFSLELDEVFAIQRGTVPAVAWRELVRQRQKEFDEYRTTPPPPDRFTTRGSNANVRASGAPSTSSGQAPSHCTEPLQDPSRSANETGHRQGIGCSPGLLRGRVRKVIDPRAASLQAGEILVAERTDPGWILLFPAAAGLLLERGSLLSHSAIVARELRLPCIVSIDGLTAWLKDGDFVEMDGASGRVRRLAPAEPEANAAPQAAASNERQSITMNDEEKGRVVCAS